jgi:integrase
MSHSEAKALAERIRTDVRAGTRVLPEASPLTPVEPTLTDVAERYLRDYARRDTRKPHAVRQFEIHVRLLLESAVDTAGRSHRAFGAVPFRAITRADLDAVFRARLDAVNAALAAARQVATLRAEQRDVPAALMKSATLAGRSTKGGHVGLNRFKARVRHLFNWAIAQGYRDDTPFKRHGVNVVRLDGAAETVRTRRLLPGEEDALMAVATPHLRGLLIAAPSTGCRLGELLSLQWRDVQCDAAGRARALVLRAGKTKTGTWRVVPVGQRLAAVLEMLRTDPEGEVLPPDAYVFGDEVGGPIASIKTTWRTACEKAGVVGLHFHDLRREFACRLLESRAELHDVRDFLGHTNLTTTSRYLRSTAMRLERALRLLEESQAASERTPPMVREGDSRSSATPVPHGAIGAYDIDDALDAEVLEAIAVGVVSPEGIDNGKARPWADAVLLMSSGIDRSEWNEEW